MDTLTHALSGMLVARATTSKRDALPLWLRSWLGFWVAAFPDIDFISSQFGISAYLLYHRGITHSILMMPLWALGFAWLFTLLLNRFTRFSVHWRELFVLFLLSIGIHIFADVITAYGTEVFAPFSSYRLSLPTTFIIDPYFSGIILLSIMLSETIRRHKKIVALTGLLLLFAYIVFQSYLMRQALSEAYVTAPIDKQPETKVSVIPQPISPFNWKLIVETESRFYVRYINLYRTQPKQALETDSLFTKVDALYTPVSQKDWFVIPKFGIGPAQALAKEIWQAKEFAPVRRFMRYPAVYQYDSLPEMQCVWFADQRFLLGQLRSPFIFGACEHRQLKERRFLRLVDGQPARFD